ncbi:glycoside hydrolase family 132 protein [Trichoderma barbatum]
MKYTILAATLAASVTAHSHHHHHHAKKDAAHKVEKRAPDVVTEVVVGATATVYQLDGKIVDPATAKAGLADGEYIVIGETTPTFVPPPPPPPPTSTSTSTTTSGGMRAQFVEEHDSSSRSYPHPPPPPPTTTAQPPASSAPPPPPKAPKKPAKPSPPSGGTGLDADFPSGKIPCSTFPSEYGAVALDWLGTGGWSGLQFVPGYSAASLSISEIITGISGQDCADGAMCSYACPPGYQKTQWSSAQGATLQSVGGLYCNNGFLELTRPDHPKLCEPGAGGVFIKNDLDESVCTCRTDYPGIESMVIPLCADPGETVPVCNPEQSHYYQWDGKSTSAQYYINKKGYGVADACVWNSPLDPKGAGNWSPIILGVGKTDGGLTFISIFQNLPTSTALLDFNIEIIGDVNSKCSYINGQWTGGSNGCTTAMPAGGRAVVRYF